MTRSNSTRPAKIDSFPNGEIAIAWDDGHESYFGGYFLRCACACASCVDEWTGEKKLRESEVPQDVHAVEIKPVGNYGITIVWSDGHDTGIYTFQRLRSIDPAPKNCSCP